MGGRVMKRVLPLFFFIGIVAVAAHFFTQGGLPFKQSLSEEEEEIQRLRSELREAQQQYRQSERAAGLSGMDTTAEAGAALDQVQRIERRLEKLKAELTTDAGRFAAQRLEEEISDFKHEIR
jgi:hypothetical protein